MKNWHKETITIDDTMVNFDQVVPLTEQMRLLEVATFNHSNIIGLDHKTMEEKSRAFWVVTKMKLIIKGDVKTGDKANVITWTHELGMARAVRDCMIKVGNSVKVKCSADWCCLDFDTRKIRKMNTIVYPDLDMQKTEEVVAEYTNMREDVAEKDLSYSRVIRATDIDVNMHTNNLKYNYMALDAFSVEELKNMAIKEYEIYFVNESHEGDCIDVYKKKIKNYFYIEGKAQDRTIFRAVIKYKKKES
ncbi:MAG: hypothetical protein E7351_01165 [Clostridiales bacterium]|nr:hypothetical protein [Clostridiales bacterium]